MRLLILLSAFVAGFALAQRNAGTFDPRATLAGTMQFAANPDGGGDCVSVSGAIVTDAGLSIGVSTPSFCPQTPAQAARVAACENIAINLVNRYAALADGGI